MKYDVQSYRPSSSPSLSSSVGVFKFSETTLSVWSSLALPGFVLTIPCNRLGIAALFPPSVSLAGKGSRERAHIVAIVLGPSPSP